MNTEQPRVVSLGDLGQLSLRGNVAFAVRCAQRVRPNFVLPKDALRQREQVAAVDGAIRVAIAFCLGTPLEPGRAAAAVQSVYVAAEETGEITNYAGYAALHAVKAVVNAEECVRNPADDSMLTEVVASAFGAGRVLAGNANAFAEDLVVAALYSDAVKLLGLAHGALPDLGPPLDPSESGPLGLLWPGGVPIGYQARPQEPTDGAG